jgi:hypothetical protein
MSELEPTTTSSCVEFKTPQVTVRFFAGAERALSRVVLWLPRHFNLFAETFHTLVHCGVCIASARLTPRGERLQWTLDLQTPDGSGVDPVRWQSVRTALIAVLLHVARQAKVPLRKRASEFRDNDAVWVSPPLLQAQCTTNT